MPGSGVAHKLVENLSLTSGSDKSKIGMDFISAGQLGITSHIRVWDWRSGLEKKKRKRKWRIAHGRAAYM